MKKTDKTIERVEREREREQDTRKIGFNFDAKNTEISVANNSCLIVTKNKKIIEYINKIWIDYVKTNYEKTRRKMFLQNSLSFLCKFNT